jgi:hypothetical protein
LCLSRGVGTFVYGTCDIARRVVACGVCHMVRMLDDFTASPPQSAPRSGGRGRAPADATPNGTLTMDDEVASRELGQIREGDVVKIRRRGEGFWCHVRSCAGTGVMDVEIDNYLLRSPELERGSMLKISESDIEDFMTKDDEAAFRELLRRTLETTPPAPQAERWAAASAAAQVIWAQRDRRSTS